MLGTHCLAGRLVPSHTLSQNARSVLECPEPSRRDRPFPPPSPSPTPGNRCLLQAGILRAAPGRKRGRNGMFTHGRFGQVRLTWDLQVTLCPHTRLLTLWGLWSETEGLFLVIKQPASSHARSIIAYCIMYWSVRNTPPPHPPTQPSPLHPHRRKVKVLKPADGTRIRETVLIPRPERENNKYGNKKKKDDGNERFKQS